jgi:hypothetical protein
MTLGAAELIALGGLLLAGVTGLFKILHGELKDRQSFLERELDISHQEKEAALDALKALAPVLERQSKVSDEAMTLAKRGKAS